MNYSDRWPRTARKHGERNSRPDSGDNCQPKFKLEPFEAIRFDVSEWRVKRVMPLSGVGAIYGASQAFKSFLASNLACHVALGWAWGGHRVIQAPVVYIAAEGARGMRKRKVGFEMANKGRLPSRVPFSLISVAPNLGAGQDDLEELIAETELSGIRPGLIVIDTLAQSLGGADENGAGMATFVANATALANHFRAFVLIVHHTGLSDKERMRGHTSLIGALDVQILCERVQGRLSSVLTVKKLKDDEDGAKFTAHLERFVLEEDEDGDDISTLIVASVERGATIEAKKTARAIPRAQRLLAEVVHAAIDQAGVKFRPFGTDCAEVKGAPEGAIRRRYYARIAELAEEGEDKAKLAERQKKAFKRAIKTALDAQELCAHEHNGERYVWIA